MARKLDTDWEAVLREYRAGFLSVREIASMYGISHTAIQKRAKKYQWKRDLAKRVQAEVARKLVADSVATVNEEEVIENASNLVMEVVRQHRKCIGKLASIEAAFAEELEGLSGDVDGKPVALSTKVSTLLALATTTEKRIKMERQAFGMTEGKQANEEENVTLLIAEGVRPIHG